MPEIPSILLDQERLGRVIYDYWISLLRTDSVEGSEDATDWSGLDEDYKRDFAEAVGINVSNVLQRYVDDLKLDEKIDKAFKESNGRYACYTCDKNAVAFSGEMCGHCLLMYAPRDR